MIPVIALTGHLGAGKTTVLNHLLRRPGARVGVVVNDFGAINVDAGLVTGQVDEAASIAGGCICCLPEAGGLDQALSRLTEPRLRLDAVIVEASGAAEPLALARLIRSSGAEHARPGGLVDVIDAVEHFRTVDTGGLPPARYAAASLVIANKMDLLPPEQRETRLAELTARVRERNPVAPVVPTERGAIDPALVFDVAEAEDPPDQLPIAALLRSLETGHDGHGHDAPLHEHASAVTARADGPADAGAILDLLEDPPRGVYRLKGCVAVRTPRGGRRYLFNLVGASIHVAPAPPRSADGADALVAIGPELDEAEVGARLAAALAPADRAAAAGLRRLQRYRRLSA
ncbi:GTP-binding protein [Leucobacter sp. CSA1]|uniref:GTP-binding protein n=1 Tax=Leucobacter chromiisoli TaxID=2796471 RepID=A0A934Q9J5_9MICO|nr:GTP-binding protein [Leucobacter chromiisoli]MBK0419047.1 GTP-binding protein [Leucobacter chromiisoli]